MISSFANPVVNKSYGSAYHKYYCEMFESEGLNKGYIDDEPILVLEGYNYQVLAYDPGSCVYYIIQFIEKGDAMNFIQKYIASTAVLGNTQVYNYELDYCSEKVCELMNQYVKQYYINYDKIGSLGNIYRYAVPLQDYNFGNEKKSSQSRSSSGNNNASSQYRPCSLF